MVKLILTRHSFYIITTLLSHTKDPDIEFSVTFHLKFLNVLFCSTEYKRKERSERDTPHRRHRTPLQVSLWSWLNGRVAT